MPYRDLRQFVKRLEEEGELVRVKTQVDAAHEIGAICRKVNNQFGPALLFENVKGYENSLVCNIWGTRKRYAMTLDTTEDKIISEFMRRIDGKGPIEPVLVKTGPCKENILIGDQVDITKFIFPIWNEKDGGPYITLPLCITKDPDTGIRNVATYRMMVHDRNTTGINLPPFRHLYMHRKKYLQRGEPIPLAIALGGPPVTHLAAVTPFPYGVDEFGMAGALQEEPLELVKCETVDLEVPAHAEIVLEGEIPIEETRPEGPYGEFTGYYGSWVQARPVFKIKAVTFRNKVMSHGLYNGVPLTEEAVLRGEPTELEAIRQTRHLDGLKKINFLHSTGDFVAVAQIHKTVDGQGKSIATGILGTSPGRWIKTLIMVDEDVDPCDMNAVNWAIATRVNPERDVEILHDFPGVELDPAMPHEEQTGMVRISKMIIDATKPVAVAYAEVCRPKPDVMSRVEKEWAKYGIS